MESNRFVTKSNNFNNNLLSKHEGISRSLLIGDHPTRHGVMSITAGFDAWPCSKKNWQNSVRVDFRTLAVTNDAWDTEDDGVTNSTVRLSLEAVNNLIANLTEVRDELVALDNEVCEAFDIIKEAEKQARDEDD